MHNNLKTLCFYYYLFYEAGISKPNLRADTGLIHQMGVGCQIRFDIFSSEFP